jgi:hypothetical protein
MRGFQGWSIPYKGGTRLNAVVIDIATVMQITVLALEGVFVDSIAEQVGYADGVTLRTLLRRRLGKGIRELRGDTVIRG